jgi:predicted nucleic acid-binding protein
VIVCDTGPLVAALSNDSDHEACVELFTALHVARRELLVPATVVAEVGYLLAREAGAEWSRCSLLRALGVWPRGEDHHRGLLAVRDSPIASDFVRKRKEVTRH